MISYVLSLADPTLPRIAAAMLLAGAVLLSRGSSHAMLASARLSCFVWYALFSIFILY